MKQLKRFIDKGGTGDVTLLCEEAEDIWHVYNLIRNEDIVKCSTYRKVVTESTTGTTSSQRVNTVLSICVENVDFDGVGNVIHLKGKNVAENEYVKMGAYHTLEVAIGRKFTLHKTQWDSVDIERLNLAVNPVAKADVAAVVMHEGLANICLLTAAMTFVKAKITMQIPRKRKGFSSSHDKGLIKFLDAVATAFLRHVDLKIVKCVIIAGRGFIHEQFLSHLISFAEKSGNKTISENRQKFLLAHASNGFKQSLKQVLSDPAMANALADTKALEEVKALNSFFDLLSNEPARAFYGFRHVMKANEEQAIESLLLSDELFRSSDLSTRRKYVELVDSLKEQGANVFIFSSMHVSGEQLSSLGGVAAILRFPLHELEDEDPSDDDED